MSVFLFQELHIILRQFLKSEIYSELARQQAMAENKMAEENSEEYKAMVEKERRFAEELAEDRPYTQEEVMKLLMCDDE